MSQAENPAEQDSIFNAQKWNTLLVIKGNQIDRKREKRYIIRKYCDIAQIQSKKETRSGRNVSRRV